MGKCNEAVDLDCDDCFHNHFAILLFVFIRFVYSILCEGVDILD